MLRTRTALSRPLAGLAVAAAVAGSGCASGVETVSPQTTHDVTSAVRSVERLAKTGCRVDGGDAGNVVHDATQTLVTVASRHPGSLISGVPIAEVIRRAAAPARRCGYSSEAQRISLAALGAARQGG